MITREYTCKKCGRIEERVSIKEPVKKQCPECGGKVKQVFGTSNDVLWFDNPLSGARTRRYL